MSRWVMELEEKALAEVDVMAHVAMGKAMQEGGSRTGPIITPQSTRLRRTNRLAQEKEARMHEALLAKQQRTIAQHGGLRVIMHVVLRWRHLEVSRAVASWRAGVASHTLAIKETMWLATRTSSCKMMRASLARYVAQEMQRMLRCWQSHAREAALHLALRSSQELRHSHTNLEDELRAASEALQQAVAREEAARAAAAQEAASAQAQAPGHAAMTAFATLSEVLRRWALAGVARALSAWCVNCCWRLPIGRVQQLEELLDRQRAALQLRREAQMRVMAVAMLQWLDMQPRSMVAAWRRHAVNAQLQAMHIHLTESRVSAHMCDLCKYCL